MQPRHPTPALRRQCRHRGLGLVEVLISLAICATLLTAVGVGFVATSNSMRNNDEFTRATQAARVCLLHLENEIRTGWVDPNITVAADGTTTQVNVITTANADLTYKYDSARKQLLLVTNSKTTDPDYVLVRNLSSARFTIQKGTDATGATCVNEVGITLTVTVGDNQVCLSGSAAPRRGLQR
jgi:type II secretory pathway pseudopilin PulG